MKEQFIEDMRKEYTKNGIDEKNMNTNPFDQFESWFEDAKKSQVIEANAVILSTASKDGRPSSRVVLIKHIDDNGFIFYTNYESRKGHELLENPFANLLFFWPSLERQVRIEGSVEKVDRETSLNYFQSRPRTSQIGAWASKQSNAIESRDELERIFKHYETQFEGQEIDLPPYWGGYRLRPEQFEFWQGRTSRLHDRVIYTQSESSWNMTRFCP